MQMQIHQYEGDLLELHRWAVNRTGNLDNPPDEFREFIEPRVRGARDEVFVGYWVGIIDPHSRLNPKRPDWVAGYPHIHSESVGWHPDTLTAITYIVCPEEGGEFGYGGEDPDDPYDFVAPEPGLTVVTDAKTYHGVRPVKCGLRVALISTGFADKGKER